MSSAHARLLIDGAWRAGTSSEVVRDRWTGEVLGDAAVASAADIEDAIGAAADAVHRPWPIADRSVVLEAAARLVEARREELAGIITAETGKPITASRTEVGRAVRVLRLSSEESRRIAGESVPLAGSPGGGDLLAVTVPVPVGVVGAITPFNFPLNLVCHKIGPALAAGCPVVLKPSEKARLTASLLARILVEAGVPAGYLNVITGDPAEIVGALQSDPRVAVLTFTGSSRVGWAIKAASPRKRHILELGSTTAMVVLDDADLDAAAQAAFESALTNSGQACISAQRVFATPAAYGPLLERLTARFDAAVAGDPRDPATLVGPLITDADVARIRGWIDAAVEMGARLLSGGIADGSVLRPTLLADAPADSLVLCAEVFGPVLTVVRVTDADAAVAAVNSADFGLNASVFTASLDRALDLGRRIESGTVLVNVAPSFRADEMPYGGVKDSGQGREGVPYAVAELTEQKLLVVRAVAT